MALIKVEREIIQEMRDCIAANIPDILHHTGDFPVIPWEAKLDGAFEKVGKVHEGSVKHKIALKRIWDAFWAIGGMYAGNPQSYGYFYTFGGQIGNVSEDTYHWWEIQMSLAWLDRILDTGEIK